MTVSEMEDHTIWVENDFTCPQRILHTVTHNKKNK